MWVRNGMRARTDKSLLEELTWPGVASRLGLEPSSTFVSIDSTPWTNLENHYQPLVLVQFVDDSPVTYPDPEYVIIALELLHVEEFDGSE